MPKVFNDLLDERENTIKIQGYNDNTVYYGLQDGRGKHKKMAMTYWMCLVKEELPPRSVPLPRS